LSILDAPKAQRVNSLHNRWVFGKMDITAITTIKWLCKIQAFPDVKKVKYNILIRRTNMQCTATQLTT